jgi:DNA-damage-inducible protein J
MSDTATFDRSANINLRIDAKTKRRASEIAGSFGITLTDAANIFFHKMVMVGGFPFDITTETPNRKTMAAIREGERLARSSKTKRYNSFSELLASTKL